MVSVIIPAYKAVKFIDECINSIRSDVKHEILIGVDACKETYEYTKGLHENVSLFYFPVNVGPYIIKNTLVDIAKYDNIMFFDADDVMAEGMLEAFCRGIRGTDYIPQNYINFQNKIDKKGHVMNDAVIGIRKDVFNSINGFYPWRCGADTEFSYRLAYNKFKKGQPEGVSYYRRLHGENLTMRKDLGHGSSIRNQYCNIINRNIETKIWPNPQIKTIAQYDKD